MYYYAFLYYETGLRVVIAKEFLQKKRTNRKLSSKQTITPSCNNLASVEKVTGTPYQQTAPT